MSGMSDEKFWDKVEIGDCCWNYSGAKNSSGYGWVSRNSKQISASRWMWFLIHGAIPQGMHVLHRCDNPACVRPKHLYLGTHKQNMIDRADRRRCPTQKLSREAVKEIRVLRSNGWTVQAIADRFHISNSHASAVSRGLHYGRE